MAATDNHGVTFLYPVGDNLTFYYLDTINVTYDSPFQNPLLYTFCDNGNDFIRSQQAAPLNGSTLVLLNWTSSTPCYFDLRPDTSAGHGANSESFTLEVDVKSQTTAGLDQPTGTPSTSSTSATSTSTSNLTSASNTSSAVSTASSTASPTASATSTTSVAASSGLSAGASAGIAIGVTLAVVLVLGVLGAWLLGRRRRRRRLAANAQSPGDATYPEMPGEYGGPKARPVGPFHEVVGSAVAQEVEGGKPQMTVAESGQAQSHTPSSFGSNTEQKMAWMPGMFSRTGEMDHTPAPQELAGRELPPQQQ